MDDGVGDADGIIHEFIGVDARGDGDDNGVLVTLGIPCKLAK